MPGPSSSISSRTYVSYRCAATVIFEFSGEYFTPLSRMVPTASAVQRKSNKAVIFSGISTENTMLFFSAAGMMADSACAVNASTDSITGCTFSSISPPSHRESFTNASRRNCSFPVCLPMASASADGGSISAYIAAAVNGVLHWCAISETSAARLR